jgi:hypothetical protein
VAGLLIAALVMVIQPFSLCSDLKIDRDLGKYHTNDLKIFCERKKFDDLTPDWRSVADLNKDLKRLVAKHTKDLSETKKMEKEQREKGLLPPKEKKTLLRMIVLLATTILEPRVASSSQTFVT